ncbi:MAG: glycosyltransferase [Caulobacteraceae bacterium]
MNILSLSTYPIRARRYGGQRRIAAFADFYQTLGATLHYAAAHIPTPGHPQPVGPDDFAIRAPHPRWDGVPFVGDIAAGEAAAEQPQAYQHFRRLIERIEPDLIQLDHPFMWPVVERARRDGLLGGVPLLYSSHNWEGPLKAQMLRAHLDAREAAEIGARIEAMEIAVVQSASAIVAVSDAEAQTYRDLHPGVSVFVVLNGVDRPPAGISTNPAIIAPFQGRRYFYFVGSAYPPNSLGFGRLVLEKGLFFHPPTPFIALCGGAAQEVLKAPSYRRFQEAHEARIRVFPNPSDADLWTLKMHAHAALLPIEFGGGSNLKTAEALATENWIVGTSTAFRGFEAFENVAGVIKADEPAAFRKAMAEVMHHPRLDLSEAERSKRAAVYWDRCFADSGLEDFIRRLVAAA